MDVTPIAPAGRQLIEAYRTGHFRVSGTEFAGSVIVIPERTMIWDRAEITGLQIDDLAAVLNAVPPLDVLLIGCGQRMAPLPGRIREDLREAGIGSDAMDSGAACRTYNVLVSENRRVAAALIAL